MRGESGTTLAEVVDRLPLIAHRNSLTSMSDSKCPSGHGTDTSRARWTTQKNPYMCCRNRSEMSTSSRRLHGLDDRSVHDPWSRATWEMSILRADAWLQSIRRYAPFYVESPHRVLLCADPRDWLLTSDRRGDVHWLRPANPGTPVRRKRPQRDFRGRRRAQALSRSPASQPRPAREPTAHGRPPPTYQRGCCA